MSDRRWFILAHDTARWNALEAVRNAPAGFVVEIKPKTRTLEQNARMWAMLTEVSRQVVWHGKRLTADEWKTVFSASLKRQEVVPGLDGGFVVMGERTSHMSVREMGDLMTLIESFGAQQGVKFADEVAA